MCWPARGERKDGQADNSWGRGRSADAAAEVPIQVTPPALPAGKPVKARRRRGVIGVQIASLLASGPDPAPIAHQDNIAEEIGGHS